MSFLLKIHHDTVHKTNPLINYIRTENCRFCVAEKRNEYGNYVNNINMYNNINGTPNNLTHNKIMYIATNKNDICSICLNNFTKNGSLLSNCLHIFHKRCLNEWLNYNKQCPLCRTNIN